MIKIGPAFSDFVSEEKIVSKAKRWEIAKDWEHHSLIPLILLVLAFSLIILRLFYLQVLRGDYYKRLSQENRTKTSEIPAPRGIIFDTKGRPLVRNSPAFKIVEVDKKGRKANTVRWLEKNEALALLAQRKDVQNDVQRDYLYKEAFAHVLGYIGQLSLPELAKPEFKNYYFADFVGKEGIERQYENILHGKNGRELFETDAHGRTIRPLGKEEEVAGKDLKTTLDLDMQLAVEEALKDVKRGAVVVSDPKNGAIRALFSKPTFDPNLFTQAEKYQASGQYRSLEELLGDHENQPFLNRVIGGAYPPGSTFKLITAVSSLEKGAMSDDTKIEDEGILRVGEFSYANWYFLCCGRTEGLLDVVGALRRSNDIFFYKAAEQTGVETLAAFAKQFGLGKALGIDIPGEVGGTVPSPVWKEKVVGEQWYLGDTYHFGIGQGYILATPLQVNFWTAVFANGGTLFRPHVVEEKAQILKKDFVKREYLELVREGMKQTCETGGVAWPFFEFGIRNQESGIKVDGKDFIEDSSGSARMVRIKVGCKTGTAEVSKTETPHAWITVFAPFYHPEVVVTVLVENGGEGSSVAGPIAKKILEEYFLGKIN